MTESRAALAALVLAAGVGCAGIVGSSARTVSEPQAATAASATSTPVPRGYKLVWSDEFDVDGRPNRANWTYETGFVRNEEAQWHQPDNATVQGGL
jgi:hypothetical protein